MDDSNMIVTDVECYVNYFLIKFKRIRDGVILGFESFEDSDLDIASINNIMRKYTHITFNGIKYDQLIVEAACQGFSNARLKEVSNWIIKERAQPWQVRAKFGFREKKITQIDIMEPAPLKGSLKVYSGRGHVKKMQDLPYPHETVLTRDQATNVNIYCDNDLHNTHTLFDKLKTQLELRETMSEEYSIDLMSKSDPQIAEAVIKHELKVLTGKNATKAQNIPKSYRYEPPDTLTFKTKVMNKVLKLYTDTRFVLDPISGKILKPKDFGASHGFENSKVVIGEAKYTIGLGGIHSCEKKICYNNTRDKIIMIDVTSYYPNIILKNRLFPPHLGPEFLTVLRSLLMRRLDAKRGAKDKSKPLSEREVLQTISDSLKIVINGTFGKTSERHSIMYWPKLMIQATITGQLSLLMLVESLELAGIQVISANTDSVTIQPSSDLLEYEAKRLVNNWEDTTGYNMEYTYYGGLYTKDLNNYLAFYDNGEHMGKGCYAETGLSKNPTNQICTDAIVKYLGDAVSVEETIRACSDIRKFISVRKVTSGALYVGQHVGQVIRWYYSDNPKDDAIYYQPKQSVIDNPVPMLTTKGEPKYHPDGSIKYKGLKPRTYLNHDGSEFNIFVGNKVAKSNGAIPIMDLPDEFPNDVNFEWYVTESKEMLKCMGVTHI